MPLRLRLLQVFQFFLCTLKYVLILQMFQYLYLLPQIPHLDRTYPYCKFVIVEWEGNPVKVKEKKNKKDKMPKKIIQVQGGGPVCRHLKQLQVTSLYIAILVSLVKNLKS